MSSASSSVAKQVSRGLVAGLAEGDGAKAAAFHKSQQFGAALLGDDLPQQAAQQLDLVRQDVAPECIARERAASGGLAGALDGHSRENTAARPLSLPDRARVADRGRAPEDQER